LWNVLGAGAHVSTKLQKKQKIMQRFQIKNKIKSDKTNDCSGDCSKIAISAFWNEKWSRLAALRD
jgi:hypothetical protein